MPISLSMSWQRWRLHTEQETEKVGREQVEVIEYRARQSIDDWGCRIQDEHRSGICYQQAGFKHTLSPRDRKGTKRDSPIGPFQVASLIPLCSKPAAWMTLMSVAHIPS